MPYNPRIHNRRSLRLKGYDYSKAGAYFITICTHDSACIFGKVIDKKMILNDFGKIAHEEWEKLPDRFPNFSLDEFQIMPNHMHGIIVLKNNDAAVTSAASREPLAGSPVSTNAPNNNARENRAYTIGDIIGAYKSLTANQCLNLFKSQHIDAGVPEEQIPKMGKIWHRNYYEIIIRNEQSYHYIANYIYSNPANWSDDKFFSK